VTATAAAAAAAKRVLLTAQHAAGGVSSHAVFVVTASTTQSTGILRVLSQPQQPTLLQLRLQAGTKRFSATLLSPDLQLSNKTVETDAISCLNS